jgi:hypothetical protein
MLAAHPAGHHAVELAGHGLVDFVAGQGESAHGGNGSWLRSTPMGIPRRARKRTASITGFHRHCALHPNYTRPPIGNDSKVEHLLLAKHTHLTFSLRQYLNFKYLYEKYKSRQRLIPYGNLARLWLDVDDIFHRQIR